MKIMRSVRILICFLFFTSIVKSQSFSPAGAVWHYNYASGFGYVGYVKIHYDHDTLILGKTSKILFKEGFGYDFLGSGYVNFFVGKEYIYEDSNVVYVLGDTGFDTLFNYNASIGDSWKNSKGNLSFGPDSNARVTVLDTGSRIINSQLLKWFNVELSCPIFSTTYQDTIFEKIGNVVNYFLSIDYCFGAVDGNEGGYFRCYMDPTFGTYNKTSEACDFILSSSEIFDNSYFEIYPNPASNLLTIKGDIKKLSELQISNLYGQQVIVTEIKNTYTIDISNLSNGIYIIQGNLNNQPFIRHFIKE